MDRYYPTKSHRRASRHEHTWNAIVDFRYLAPAKLAREEAHERMQSGPFPLPSVSGYTPMIGIPPLMNLARQRLGGVFILIGTTLQGAHGVPDVIA